jgi:CHAT domain-containing protein
MLRGSFPAKSSKDRGALRLVEPIAQGPARFRTTLWAALRVPVETLALGGAVALALFALPWSPWRPDRLENRYVRAQAELLALGHAPEGRLFALPDAGPPPPPAAVKSISPALRLRVRRLANEPRLRPERRAALLLMLGDAAGAVEVLGPAGDADPKNAALANDRAVARIAYARQPGEADELLAAFADLGRVPAGRDPGPQTPFNRALLLERLQLLPQAAEAWKAVPGRDPGTEWARLAARNLETARKRSLRGDWDAAAASLVTASLQGRQDRVKAVVDAWPQRTRLWAEIGKRDGKSLLGIWAFAATAADPTIGRAERDASLATALAIGRALERRSGERMLLESAQAIEYAQEHDAARLAFLALGHRRYREGFVALNEGRLSTALQAMAAAEAALRSGRSPFEGWARYWIAACRFRLAENPRAATVLQGIEETFPKKSYPSLWATSTQLHGLIEVVEGNYAGVERYRKALQKFADLEEWGQAGKAAALIGEVELQLGLRRQAWQTSWNGLRQAYRYGESYDLYIALETMARLSLSLGEPRLALAYQDSAVKMVRETSMAPQHRLTSLRLRAELRRAAGNPGPALADLEEAERVAGGIPQFADGASLRADLAFTRGQMLRAAAPRRAAVLLTAALRSYEATRYGYRLGLLQMERGRARRDLGDLDGAERDFEATLEGFERQRESVGTELDRISYLDQQRALIDEVIGFQSTVRKRPERALATAERFRSPALGSQIREREPETSEREDRRRLVPTLQSGLDPDMALVEIVVLPDQILTWVIRRGATLASVSVKIDRAVLEQRVEQLDRRLGSSGGAAFKAGAGRLYDLLWRPLEKELDGVARVVLVADPILQRLPFAALWNATERRYLIERQALIVAPGARLFAAAADRGWSGGTQPRLLLLADPALSADRDYARLPFARQEARETAPLFPGSRPLVGDDATRERFLALADSYDVFHFAGHATVDPAHPERSRLLLAGPGSGGEGDLSGEEIGKRRFRSLRLAVLAGCRTGSGIVSASEGTMTLGRAFLGAGVPAVLTARDAIGDVGSKTFLLRFYRHLGRGLPLSQALRQAQRESIPDLPLSLWAGMTLGETRPAAPVRGSTRSIQKS